MADYWVSFCDKVEAAGYTMKDLEFCSDDLFLTIAEELGTFSPLQISSLLSYWHRMKRAGNLTTTSSPPPPRVRNPESSAVSSTSARPAPAYPAASIRQAADKFLRRVCSGQASPRLAVADVIGVEAPASAWHAFNACVARQEHAAAHERSREAVSLLWKLCSPATLTKIERACAASSPLHITSADDPDALCESGVVVYDGALAATLGSNAVTPAILEARVATGGWALVAFDVAVGRTRAVAAEEVANLSSFSSAQCNEMLLEAGFDSLTIPTTGAVVLCDPTQLLPRNVVYFHLAPAAAAQGPVPSLHNSRRLDYSQTDDDPASRRRLPSAAPPSPQEGSSSGNTRQLAIVPTPTPTASAVTSPDASLITRCEVHPHKEVEFWSPAEKRLLCSHCLYYDNYSRENCVPIEVGARQEVPRLERWVANAESFGKEVQRVVQLFADAQADMARHEDKAARAIADQVAAVRARLDALGADMLHDVREQCRARAQEVAAAATDVAETVGRVAGLLAEVEAPMKAYRHGGSAAGLPTCVQILRGVQRAFADWPTVDIAPYAVAQPPAAFLADAEAAVARVPKVAAGPGKVELPEAIDVNYLHADCE